MGIDRSRYGKGREAQGAGGGGRDDAELIDLREGQDVPWEGVFEKTQEPIGNMKSPMHHFTDGNGAAVKMWGTTVLTDKLSEAKPGNLVEIIYRGMVAPKGAGNAYHSFDVTIFEEAPGAGPQREAPRAQGTPAGAGTPERRGGQPAPRAAAPAGRAASTPTRREPDRLPPQDDSDDIPW